MAFKLVVLCAFLAYANAGGIIASAPAAVHYSDASAVSSQYLHQATAPVAVAKVAAAPVAYAAPAVQTYAAPAVHTYAAPAVHTYAAPAVAKVATPFAYAAHTYAAPAVQTYAAPAVHAYATPAVQAYAAPAIAKVATTYSASPVAIHDPHYGSTHQSVYRSLGGDHAVSHYSKAVDSAFSSVRKYDTRITNDAQHILAASPVVSTYAAHAPVVAHAPVLAHAQPIVSTYAAHSPVVAHGAPLVAHAQPVVSAYAAHGPVVAHASPVLAKTAIAYSPAAVVSHATFTGLGAHYEW